MSVGDDIVFLTECEEHSIAASVQLEKVQEACDAANEELTKVINRLVLVRGQDASIPTLDQAIARAEESMTRINHISAETAEVDEVVEATIHLANTFKGKLLS